MWPARGPARSGPAQGHTASHRALASPPGVRAARGAACARASPTEGGASPPRHSCARRPTGRRCSRRRAPCRVESRRTAPGPCCRQRQQRARPAWSPAQGSHGESCAGERQAVRSRRAVAPGKVISRREAGALVRLFFLPPSHVWSTSSLCLSATWTHPAASMATPRSEPESASDSASRAFFAFGPSSSAPVLLEMTGSSGGSICSMRSNELASRSTRSSPPPSCPLASSACPPACTRPYG